MQVVNLTTPSNYFHVLRRQMRREFRKPLIIATPKSLLRHKRCVSTLSEMEIGTTFHRVLWDDRHSSKELDKDENIRRVVLCSGKVYYDLAEERDKRGLKDIFIMRVEQLYPFRRKRDQRPRTVQKCRCCMVSGRTTQYGRLVLHSRTRGERAGRNWCKERSRTVCRTASGPPATGSLRRHTMEQENLVGEARTLPPKRPGP